MSAMPVLAAAILLFAAWCDLATRTIPDRCSVALLVLGVAGRLAEGPLAVAASIGLAALLGVGFLLLHARGVIGGGDVKLILALTAGTAPADVPDLLYWIVVAGGVLGLLYLLLWRVMPRPAMRPGASLPVRVAVVEVNRIARRGPLPYAVAIAVGGVAAGLGANAT